MKYFILFLPFIFLYYINALGAQNQMVFVSWKNIHYRGSYGRFTSLSIWGSL